MGWEERDAAYAGWVILWRWIKWVGTGAAIAVLALLAWNAWASAPPPTTTLKVCTGTLPVTSLLSNHDGGCHTYDVSATEKLAADLLNHGDDDTFRHVYYRGGDPACVFTARISYPNPDEPSWARTRIESDVSGGRECNAHTRDGQCAYIAQGYSILAVTGQSCSEAGVPLCTGPFCR